MKTILATIFFGLVLQINTLFSQVANPSDSSALVNFYNATFGSVWTIKTNWLTGPVKTWHGVTLDNNGRVISLVLIANAILGVIPESFSSLTNLQTLNLSGNSLTGLPGNFNMLQSLMLINLNSNALNGLPSLNGLAFSSLDVSNNFLTFKDLEPIGNRTGVIYSPQRKFGGANSTLVEGKPLVLNFLIGGSVNTYQWYKDGNAIASANSNPFRLTSSAVLTDGGIFRLEISNSLVPGLVLVSNNILITIIPVGSQTYFSWPGHDGISTDTAADSHGGFWADFDNDNDEDLLVNNLSTPGRSTDLYENLGNGVFKRLRSANNPLNMGARNVTWADMDNDGFLDFFIGDAFINPNGNAAFYRNNGNKTFSGIPIDYSAMGGTFVDYDNDGLVDISVVRSPAGSLPMLKNLGGSFSIISNKFSEQTQWVMLWADIDNDNDQDVVQIGNNASLGSNYLYRNDGNGQFTKLANNLITTTNLVSARGGSWADIDNDGDVDLFAMDTYAAPSLVPKSVFYINDGTGNFTMLDASAVLGINVIGRSSSFGDLDNDGDLDLVIISHLTGDTGIKLFLNNGNGVFNFVSSSQQGFIPFLSYQFCQVSLADYDNDGFLDLFAAAFSRFQPPSLYRNKGNSGNNWIKIKLVGVQSNRAAIGAKVRIKTGGKWQLREIASQTGLSSQNSLIAHFGVTGNTTIDSIKVKWPSGIESVLKNQNVNQLLEIIEIPKQNQTITFNSIANKLLGEPSFNLMASSTSMLPITFTTNSDIVLISGSNVDMIKAGRVTISANQNGNLNFHSATPQYQSFCINPKKPTITAEGLSSPSPILISSAIEGNQWLMNGTAIIGATNSTFNVNEDGSYSVQLTIDDCKSERSNETAVIILGLETNKLWHASIYPNPVLGLLRISAETISEKTITIIDSNGRSVASTTSSQQIIEIDVSFLTPSLYCVKVQTNQGLVTRKFVKQ